MKTYAEFWPFYLREHSKATTRNLHYAGTTCAVAIGVTAAVTLNPWLVPAVLVVGYGPAWIGHFFIEKNRPATFKYPVWSFVSDFRMLGYAVSGKLPAELERAGVQTGELQASAR
jgi:hypothetical protein